jgi:Phage integrase family
MGAQLVEGRLLAARVRTDRPAAVRNRGLGMSGLTLAEAARMMRQALRDRSYRATPLGLEVARYYRWKKNEWGATAETLRDYEAILSKLALDHADLEFADFEPPVGTERLHEFIDSRWADRTARNKGEGDLSLPRLLRVGGQGTTAHREPCAADLPPTETGGRPRDVHRRRRTQADRRPAALRDRVALLLLYPEKLGPEFYGGPVGVIWENRLKPLSSTALHRWWVACLKRAGIAHRAMHEARHTAITAFLRRTGNLKLAQMLAGHADIGTTANIYAHLDTSDLETALKALNEGPR